MTHTDFFIFAVFLFMIGTFFACIRKKLFLCSRFQNINTKIITMNERQTLNRQLAQMLKGGVIMDVTTPEQARIAEEAGACAVMALERIPADIRAAGGVSRMSDPK